MKHPPLSGIAQRDTHRLIPSKYGRAVLENIVGQGELTQLLELEGVTNERVLAENNLCPGIGQLELVYRVPFAHVINGAYTHKKPSGSRFNGPDRGAWYSCFEKEGALAEIIFHKTLDLIEIDFFEDEVEYHEFLADFTGDFHDIRNAAEFDACLDPMSYIESQNLAHELLYTGSIGIVYPSVRLPGATNIVCFRPAMVDNVRRNDLCKLVWSGSHQPQVIWNPVA